MPNGDLYNTYNYGAGGGGYGYGSAYGGSYNSGWQQPKQDVGFWGGMLNLAPALLGAAATVYSATEARKAAQENSREMINAQNKFQSQIAAEAAKVGPAAVKQDFTQIANQTRSTNRRRGIASTIYSNQKLLGAAASSQYLGG